MTAGLDAGVVAELRRSFAAALSEKDQARARESLLAAGWLEALDADESVSVAIVFGLQGSTRGDVAALDDVIAHHVGAPADGSTAVAYPVTMGGKRTHVAFGAHADAQRLVWVGEETLDLVTIAAGLDGPRVQGVDPDLNLISLPEPPTGTSTPIKDAAQVWERALAAGRIALSHQLAGASRTVLDLALSYAQSRRQFGTSIATFQAVKHRLAETLVAIEAAYAAALAAATNRNPISAAVAKALAGRAAEVAGRHCLQVFGGVGFTLEHDFHLYFQRNLLLGRLLGDQRTLERELGARLRTGALRGERIVEIDDLPPAVLLQR